jgi:hypothetical protein
MHKSTGTIGCSHIRTKNGTAFLGLGMELELGEPGCCLFTRTSVHCVFTISNSEFEQEIEEVVREADSTTIAQRFIAGLECIDGM